MTETKRKMITSSATVSRRQVLSSVSAGLSAMTFGSAAGVLSAAQVSGSEVASGVVVDTHLHCFAGDDPKFPYHADAPYRPANAASPEHLLKCMDGAGVDYAVVVHPEPYQDDHRYLEHCLQVGGSRLKGTCLFFAHKPNFAAEMAQLVKQHPGQIVAARLHAYAPGRLPDFESREVRELWKTATDLGLAMQLHFEPRYAARLEPLIREFPDTTVIIDHLGRPMQGTPKEHGVVVAWSKYPNTIMKVSSLPDINRYPHRDVQPVIRQLVKAWGPDRMIYGGGFNSQATPASYRAYRNQVSELLSDLSESEQQKVLGGTAARVFGFAAQVR